MRGVLPGRDGDRCHLQLVATGSGADDPLSKTFDTGKTRSRWYELGRRSPMNAMTVNYLPVEMKASDSDRDAVVSDLSEHFQAGRLTAGEFDERTGRALAARTWGELRNLLTDLPATRPGPSAPATRSSSAPPQRSSVRLPCLRSPCWPPSGSLSPCWSMCPTSGGASSGSFFRAC